MVRSQNLVVVAASIVVTAGLAAAEDAASRIAALQAALVAITQVPAGPSRAARACAEVAGLRAAATAIPRTPAAVSPVDSDSWAEQVTMILFHVDQLDKTCKAPGRTRRSPVGSSTPEKELGDLRHAVDEAADDARPRTLAPGMKKFQHELVRARADVKRKRGCKHEEALQVLASALATPPAAVSREKWQASAAELSKQVAAMRDACEGFEPEDNADVPLDYARAAFYDLVRLLPVSADATPAPALAPAAAPAAALPAEAQAVLFDLYYVEPADRAGFLAEATKASADLNGDGKPDFVVEIQRESGSDKSVSCTSLLLASGAAGWSWVGDVACCNPKAVAAASRSGGRVECLDDKKPKTAIAWSGRWPANPSTRVTQTQVKAGYEQGLPLMKAGRFAEARAPLCLVEKAAGATQNPTYVNGCAGVLIRLDQLDAAKQILVDSVGQHPDAYALYANLGTIAEKQKDARAALDWFEKYLAKAPVSPNRAAVEKKVVDLKKATGR